MASSVKVNSPLAEGADRSLLHEPRGRPTMIFVGFPRGIRYTVRPQVRSSKLAWLRVQPVRPTHSSRSRPFSFLDARRHRLEVSLVAALRCSIGEPHLLRLPPLPIGWPGISCEFWMRQCGELILYVL